MPALENLTKIIANGYPESAGDNETNLWKTTIDDIFGERYRADAPRGKRVVITTSEEYIPFAGLIHQDNPNSGPYGGFCLVWFPIKGNQEEGSKSLLAFGCGTRGLAPDENILARPGHGRYLSALRKYINDETGVFTWCKNDPSNLSESIPEVIKDHFSDFKNVFSKYGNVLHFMCEVPHDFNKALFIVRVFLDFYAWERGWKVLTAAKNDSERLFSEIQDRIFSKVDVDNIYKLLLERYYVILTGPPGTGKTMLANQILNERFSNNGKSVQFHPATTYENFVIGLQPNVLEKELTFKVANGFLTDAVIEANKNKDEKYLLLIDEINRADLGKVLGEAIALFEYLEVRRGESRTITLPYKNHEIDVLTLPKNLYILGTMNSADRSIAILDLAVRRRFAFMDVWPQKTVVDRLGSRLASEAFSNLLEIFIQYSTDENLVLMPGHSYFLADNEEELVRRFEFELIPLLKEYIRDGRIASLENQLQGFIDWLELSYKNKQ